MSLKSLSVNNPFGVERFGIYSIQKSTQITFINKTLTKEKSMDQWKAMDSIYTMLK